MWKNRLLTGLIGLVVLFSLLYCRAAQACPICDSDRARLVRAGLFDSRFVSNLAVTVLPFVVLAAIVALTHYGLPLPRRVVAKRGIE